MRDLLPFMIERVGILVLLAFLLTRLKFFRQLADSDRTPRAFEKLLLLAIFAAFGIVSTYTGIEVKPENIAAKDWIGQIDSGNAIANTRNVGVVIGGLLGGPLVGLGVGIIAGAHRYMLGGFTGLACALSTMAGGWTAGWLGRRIRRQGMTSAVKAAAVGMLVELMQMGIILLVAKPFDRALQLVQLIGLPMIVVNGLGVWVFVQILHTVLREEQRTRAMQTQKALLIADRTLPFFRQGLNEASCREAAQIIFGMTGADAVAVTDRSRVLAHVGAASDHHRPMPGIATRLTRDVLESGEIRIARTPEEIRCDDPRCPLRSAVVIPLKIGSRTVGALKLYFVNPNRIGAVEKELAEGLARLFSTQLEIGETEHQIALLRDAEVKALQAQIHPHFLFNAINTIVALCRTDAELARKMLVNLSHFFRSNLHGARQTVVPLEQELRHVEAYLSLEQARFPGRYTLHLDIQSGLEQALIPPFTLQPLIENAVRHGLAGKREGGTMEIRAYADGRALHIRVSDNGDGIAEDKLPQLGRETVPSREGTGTALNNIYGRLFGLYGANLPVRNRHVCGLLDGDQGLPGSGKRPQPAERNLVDHYDGPRRRHYHHGGPQVGRTVEPAENPSGTGHPIENSVTSGKPEQNQYRKSLRILCAGLFLREIGDS